MKRTIFTLLLVLLLSFSVALADWQCTSCGTANTGAFCEECGTARPSLPDTCPLCDHDLTMLARAEYCPFCGAHIKNGAGMVWGGITRLPNGQARIVWGDPHKKGPYSVTAKLIIDGLDVVPDTLTGSTNETEVITWQLIPGKTYLLTVTDSTGASIETTFFSEDEVFIADHSQARYYTTIHYTNGYTDYMRIPSSYLLSSGEACIMINQLSMFKENSYWVMEAPNGMAMTVFTVENPFSQQDSCTHHFFEWLNKTVTGELPGIYTLKYYEQGIHYPKKDIFIDVWEDSHKSILN